jgi:hypothetical protein
MAFSSRAQKAALRFVSSTVLIYRRPTFYRNLKKTKAGGIFMRRFYRLPPVVRMTFVALAVFSLPLSVVATQLDLVDQDEDVVIEQSQELIADNHGQCNRYQDISTSDNQCNRMEKTATSCPAVDTCERERTCASTVRRDPCDACAEPEVLTLDTLIEHQEEYYGKTVTVEGELHRFFTDNVFTIEDDDFFSDDDVLVISKTGPMCDAVSSLDKHGEIEKGKDVCITGVVRPYDRGKLECEYGPLNLESREGHSFTKSPVLIVGDRPVQETVMVEPPEPIVWPEPTPAPEPEIAEVEEVEIAEVEFPAPADELPRTSSNLPFVGLAGLLSIFGAGAVGLYRRSTRDR